MNITVPPSTRRLLWEGAGAMLGGRVTQAIVRFLDRVAPEPVLPDDVPEHLRTGRRGEEDAYFYLRRRGYTMIARNYRSPNYRGEIDLIGWDGDVLCFIEVKTRTTRAVKPAEAAVDREKQKELQLVARDFLRHLPAASCPSSPQHASGWRDGANWRFDVVAVYYDRGFDQPSYELFQNAFSVAYNHQFARSHGKDYQ